MHQLFVLPGQPAEQQRGVGALVPGERPLLRALEMVEVALLQAGFPLQAGALFGQPLLDDVFDRIADLDEVRGLVRRFRFESLSAHSLPLRPRQSGRLHVCCEAILPVNRLKEKSRTSNGDFINGNGGIRRVSGSQIPWAWKRKIGWPNPELGRAGGVRVFQQVLGFVYFIAFTSFGRQAAGLIGSHGILPFADYLAA